MMQDTSICFIWPMHITHKNGLQQWMTSEIRSLIEYLIPGGNITAIAWLQWRRLHRARGHVPPLLPMAGHSGGTVSRTANQKLTRLYWQSRKRSPKRLIVILEQKSQWARPQFSLGALRRTGARAHFRAEPVPPSPTFKFVPAPLLDALRWRKNLICIAGFDMI